MMVDYYLHESIDETTSIYERGTSRIKSLTQREACDLLNDMQGEIERLRELYKTEQTLAAVRLRSLQEAMKKTDEAREAARWFFTEATKWFFTDCIETKVIKEAMNRWPWLEEK